MHRPHPIEFSAARTPSALNGPDGLTPPPASPSGPTRLLLTYVDDPETVDLLARIGRSDARIARAQPVITAAQLALAAIGFVIALPAIVAVARSMLP